MVSNEMGTSLNNIFKVKKHSQTLIILKNQLNHQLNIVILKKFAHYEMFREVFFVSSQIYLKVIFYIAQGFLY